MGDCYVGDRCVSGGVWRCVNEGGGEEGRNADPAVKTSTHLRNGKYGGAQKQLQFKTLLGKMKKLLALERESSRSGAQAEVARFRRNFR